MKIDNEAKSILERAGMFEHRSEPLLPVRLFVYRVIRHSVIAFVVIGIALGIGVAGYHQLAGLGWLDSFLNASMILGGMGPVAELHNSGAKVFAGLYALFSGLVFIAAVSIIIIPLAHRFLHALHLEVEE